MERRLEGTKLDSESAGESGRHEAGLRKLFAAAATLLLATVFFWMVAPFLVSLLFGALLSHMLYPVYRWLCRACRSDFVAAFVTTIGTLVVFAVPVTLLIGAVSREAVELTDAVEPWIEQQTNEAGPFLTIPEWMPFSEQLQPYRQAIVQRTGNALEQLGSFVVQNISRIAQSTLGYLLQLFVMLYALFSFLLKGPSLLQQLSDYIPLSAADQRRIVERGIAVTRATLKSIVVIGAIQGLLGGLAFAVVGIQGAVFWGLVMAFASAIPGVGAALIWIPASIALAIRGDLAAAAGLALAGALLVSSVDNVLRPWLIGHEVRMPDLLVLVSTLGGIAMFGAPGLVLGPALAGIFITSLNILFAAIGHEPASKRTSRLLGASVSRQESA